MLCKLRGACHCTLAKCMTRNLRHVAEAIPSARQGTILNSHRVTGIATNTSMVLNCALDGLHNDDSRCRTAGCSLTSYPGHLCMCCWTCRIVNLLSDTSCIRLTVPIPSQSARFTVGCLSFHFSYCPWTLFFLFFSISFHVRVAFVAGGMFYRFLRACQWSEGVATCSALRARRPWNYYILLVMVRLGGGVYPQSNCYM